MKRLAQLAAAVCLASPLHASQTPATMLELGKPVARDIAVGDTHTYRISVQANDAVHLVARQLGADVVLTLLDSDAKSIVEMDTPTGSSGAESIWFVVPRAGELLVQVRPFDRSGGRYELRLDARRPATAEDPRRVHAQGLMLEALRLDDGSMAAAIQKLKEAVSIARSLGDGDAVGLMMRALADFDVDVALDAMGLDVITGRVRAYYSSGFRERADAVRHDVERISAFFEKTLGVSARVSLAVLTPQDWSAACFSGAPYGMPSSRASRSGAGLVCIGSTYEFSDAMARSLRGQLPPKDAAAMETALGMPFEEAMRKFSDTIVAHELGHLYTLAFGIIPPTQWMNELLANYMEIAYRSGHPPDEAEQRVRAMFDQLGAKRPIPANTTLEDFERLYVGMPADNYVWYQQQFARRAEAVFQSRGLAFLSDVKTAFPRDEPRPIPVQITLERLEKIAPGFVQWAGRLGKGGLATMAPEARLSPAGRGLRILDREPHVTDRFRSRAAGS